MKRALLLACCLLILPTLGRAQDVPQGPDEVSMWKVYGEYIRSDRDAKEGIVASCQATVEWLKKQLDEQKKLVETLTKKLEEKK